MQPLHQPALQYEKGLHAEISLTYPTLRRQYFYLPNELSEPLPQRPEYLKSLQ